MTISYFLKFVCLLPVQIASSISFPYTSTSTGPEKLGLGGGVVHTI